MDNVVTITTENTAIIRGSDYPDVSVQQLPDEGEFFITQDDGDVISFGRAEAEALFLVLDTMLHQDEA